MIRQLKRRKTVRGIKEKNNVLEGCKEGRNKGRRKEGSERVSKTVRGVEDKE